MSKFTLDTNALAYLENSFINLKSQMSELSSEISSYDVSEASEFNFSSAINAISSNIEEAGDKFNNTAKLLNNVIETHTNVQNSLKFNSTNSYTVKKGDTLHDIAEEYNVDLKELIAYNNISDPNIILVGEKILIPTTGVVAINKNKVSTPEKTNNTVSQNRETTSKTNQPKEETKPENSNTTYKSKGSFQVTNDNKKYNLSESELDFFMAVVASEADKDSIDDCLAVSSVILNRCEAKNWVASHGTDPIRQIKAPGQFAGYFDGYYKKYLNGNVNNNVRTAVMDALNGTRNCDYLSFRSNGSTKYSNNMISSGGNRYK